MKGAEGTHQLHSDIPDAASIAKANAEGALFNEFRVAQVTDIAPTATAKTIEPGDSIGASTKSFLGKQTWRESPFKQHMLDGDQADKEFVARVLKDNGFPELYTKENTTAGHVLAARLAEHPGFEKIGVNRRDISNLKKGDIVIATEADKNAFTKAGIVHEPGKIAMSANYLSGAIDEGSLERFVGARRFSKVEVYRPKGLK